MHSLSTSFILGYHGCDLETSERLLRNEPFRTSDNGYDWLGSGAYFWEANPDRALEWARQHRPSGPAVVGAVIDPGFCLDLITSNGTSALASAYQLYTAVTAASGTPLPTNTGGEDYLHRKLDCAVINFLHTTRKREGDVAFDTVRGVFMEGERLYPTSGFRRQSHIQICVRNPAAIKGVFRVPTHQLSQTPPK
jgi:hypothetical protein